MPKGRPQRRVLRAQGRGGQAGPWTEEHKASWREGAELRPRAETKVLSALLLGADAFQRRGCLSSEQQQPCGKSASLDWEQELELEREACAHPQAHFPSSPLRRSYDNI